LLIVGIIVSVALPLARSTILTSGMADTLIVLKLKKHLDEMKKSKKRVVSRRILLGIGHVTPGA
jgi:hypothetical protein